MLSRVDYLKLARTRRSCLAVHLHHPAPLRGPDDVGRPPPAAGAGVGGPAAVGRAPSTDDIDDGALAGAAEQPSGNGLMTMARAPFVSEETLEGSEEGGRRARALLAHLAPIGRPSEVEGPDGGGARATATPIVVGDETGALVCFAVVDGSAKTLWTTKLERAVGCVTLDVSRRKGKGTRLVVASGSQLRFMDLKGSLMKTFESTLTDAIRFVAVRNETFLIATEYAYNHYEDGKDLYFYQSAGA
ncbi:Bardet-Biedl syndrome 7 protein [Irineochytrium annulatum]|nr:Bardet-Biedl syndrome 7 protein [Irineochytrium annulatum]